MSRFYDIFLSYDYSLSLTVPLVQDTILRQFIFH